MKKEFKRIKKFGKKIIGKDSYKKLKKIKDYREKTEGLKYLISSKLEVKLLELESKINEVDGKKSWIAESKLMLLPPKIKLFKTTYSEEDYKKIAALIKDIEGELKKCLDS